MQLRKNLSINLASAFKKNTHHTGGSSVQFYVLSDKSRKLIKRVIAMSGTVTSGFAYVKPNNHIAFYKKVFELDSQATAEDVLKFMSTAPVDIILRKTPVVLIERNVVGSHFAAVIEGLS